MLLQLRINVIIHCLERTSRKGNNIIINIIIVIFIYFKLYIGKTNLYFLPLIHSSSFINCKIISLAVRDQKVTFNKKDPSQSEIATKIGVLVAALTWELYTTVKDKI